MIARIVRTAFALCLVLSQACLVSVGRRPNLLPEHYGQRTGADRENQGIPFGPKPVVGKEKPTRLLARDGTSCVVSREKFESVVLGTTVWCSWMDVDR